MEFGWATPSFELNRLCDRVPQRELELEERELLL